MSSLLFASEATHAVATSPLTAAIALPFLGAAAVALIPAARTELHRLVALLFSAGAGAITLWLLAAFETSEPGFQFEVDRSWISDFGISWHLGIDGVSLFLVVLTGLLFPLAILAVTPHHDPKPYYAWLLVLQEMAEQGKPLAALVGERMRLFPASGEINRSLPDAKAALAKVRRHYESQALSIDHTDGLSMEFERWRFNLRASNTEPLVRLNVESRGSEELMREKTASLLALLDS